MRWIARSFVSGCFERWTTGPPPPPWLLGIQHFGAPDYPPSAYDTKKGVRVIRRIQLVILFGGEGGPIAGRRSDWQSRSEVGR
jgi:hypothetical protein